jgi:hypothetical protein
MLHQAIAQPSMLNAFHRFADEGLDQERLGFFLGNSPRFEVKQETFVEAACGSAVAALDVVSEDLQLRLVVRLCSIRKQQRVRGHLGVRLLRARTHDDPALKHAVGFAVEHGFEQLTARASARGVLRNKRCIRVLPAFQHASAADGRDRALACKTNEELVAQHR